MPEAPGLMLPPLPPRPKFDLTQIDKKKIAEITEQAKKEIFAEEKLKVYKEIFSRAQKGHTHATCSLNKSCSKQDILCLVNELEYKGFKVELNLEAKELSIYWF